jgi:integrase
MTTSGRTEPNPASELTLAAWLTLWFTAKTINGDVTATSIAALRSDVQRIRTVIGDVKLVDVTPAHFADLGKAGWSPATTGHTNRTLLRALTEGAKQGHLHWNLADLVRSTPVLALPQPVYTEAEIAALLDAAAYRRNGPRWEFALLGLRVSEVLALKWRDLTLTDHAGQVHIQHTLWWDRDGTPTLKRLKSEAGRRTLALPSPLVRALLVHQGRQDDEKRAAGSAWTDDGFLVADLLGAPIKLRADIREWVALTAAAGVRLLGMNSLRLAAARRIGGANNG